MIYESADLYHWNFLDVLAESRGEWGFMWECPDFYQLGDKYVLTFSPMGSGDHTSVYLTGDFDYKTGQFDWHISGEMDWGFDFYAPQSMVAPWMSHYDEWKFQQCRYYVGDWNGDAMDVHTQQWVDFGSNCYEPEFSA